jgi:hypothetical protein
VKARDLAKLNNNSIPHRPASNCFYSVRSARIGSIVAARRLLGVYAAR